MFWWLFKYCCLNSCNLRVKFWNITTRDWKSLVLILTFASKKNEGVNFKKEDICSCFILNCLQALTFQPVLQFEYSRNAWGRFEQ